jgi:hypothetical protein
MNIKSNLRDIEFYFEEQEKRFKKVSERNIHLIKVLATIRSKLEKTLKNNSVLNQSVYESIDLCRENLLYTEMSTGINKIDPPLTEEEKTLKE